ncbi:putative ribonuclease H-like domain-containing protein [Tanacetum coccineum]
MYTTSLPLSTRSILIPPCRLTSLFGLKCDQHVQDLRAELVKLLVQQKEGYANSTNRVSTVSRSVSFAGQSFEDGKISEEYAHEPKKVTQALTDPSWIEAMQDELLQFGLQKMDVKSAFLYGTIEEEVFRRGTIDKTLFIKKEKGDILLVQVYVDDIIFGSTKKSLCVEFEQMMHKRFQMSSMGELTFFLGLQVKQKDDGIFISQDKYVADILKKFDFINDWDHLMQLDMLWPDIMFAVCACARFQVTPKVSHLHAVKRIFRYLKGQPKLGLWYPRDSPFDLEAFFDSDYAGASLDMEITMDSCPISGNKLISGNVKANYGCQLHNTEATFMIDVVLKIGISDEFGMFITGSCKVNAARQDLVLLGEINDVKQIHATVDGKTIVISESLVRSDLYFNDEDGITCLTNETIFENLALMGFSPYIVKNGKDFSGRITPLFASMLAPPVVEGEGLGQPTEP